MCFPHEKTMLKQHCYLLSLFPFLIFFLLTMFIVMHPHTKANSLYVQTYLAINLILIKRKVQAI